MDNSGTWTIYRLEYTMWDGVKWSGLVEGEDMSYIDVLPESSFEAVPDFKDGKIGLVSYELFDRWFLRFIIGMDLYGQVLEVLILDMVCCHIKDMNFHNPY